MVEAFSGGAMVPLVTGIGFDGLNKPANVLTVGLGYSVIHSAVCKAMQVVDKSIKHNQQEELFSYATTKNMLASIGLPHLEDNFKNASLSDITLPLLTDSALKEAKIPAGARLLILDKIKRDPELRKALG